MIRSLCKVPQVIGWQRGDSNPLGPILKPICYLPSHGTAFSTMGNMNDGNDSKLQTKAHTG